MLNPNPWPEFKDSPALRTRWIGMGEAHKYLPHDDEQTKWDWIFNKPIFRTLLAYGAQGGAGMSLFGLAALTHHEPREVWEQVQREAVSEGCFCGTTKLFVINSFCPYDVEDMVPIEGSYDYQIEDYDEAAEEYSRNSGYGYGYDDRDFEPLPSFEEMFNLFPRSKCRVRFNPWGTKVHNFTPEAIRDLRKVFTLGLAKRNWNAHLL